MWKVKGEEQVMRCFIGEAIRMLAVKFATLFCCTAVHKMGNLMIAIIFLP